MTASPDELNSLHVAVADRALVLEAIAAEAESAGLSPVAPELLGPHGRWFHGEEDPGVRRFLVAPPGERWTTILPSATDWDRDWCQELAAHLGCRAVYLMLHDGDVFSLHLFDGALLIGDYLSSPDYFDLPPRPEGDLGFRTSSALPFFRPGTTEEELVEALTPPGEIDIDGRLAFERCAKLLDLPVGATNAYGLTLDRGGVTPLPTYAEHVHVAFRIALEGDEDGSVDLDEEEDESVARPSIPATPMIVEDDEEDEDEDANPGGASVLRFPARPSVPDDRGDER